MKKALILISALVMCGTAMAQNNKNAVVNVENDYNPVHIEVGKKAFVPNTERNVNMRPVKMVYSKDVMPYTGFTSERDVKDILPKKEELFPGYVRLGYGVTNDADAKAAYRLGIGENGTLKAFAAFDGYKCNIDKRFNDRDLEWNSRLFRNAVGVGYTHRFKALTLDADGSFSNSVFNYQSTEDVITPFTDRQNERDYMLSIGGVSNLSGAFSYNFKGDFEYMARSYSTGARNGIGEGRFGIGGGVGYEIVNKWISKLGVDLNFDAFIYNKTLKEAKKGYNEFFSIDVDPYTNLTIGDIKARAGIKMNFVTEGAAIFAIAPDIRAEYNLKENISFYGSITGGRESNSLAKLSRITPYWGFSSNGDARLKPTYRIVDLKAGTRISFEPLSISAEVGYAYTKDDLLQAPNPLMSGQFTLMYVDFKQGNTHHAYVGARVGYDLLSWVKVSADARYDYWHCKEKDYLIMKPQFTADINAEGRIIEHLTLQVGYNYTNYTKTGTRGRLGDKHDLYARLNYQITKRFGAYIQGNNLLNQRYYEYVGYETRGIRGSLGATVNF